MIWLALGEYRGPLSARAFFGYLTARVERETEERSYRAYVTDCIGALAGASRRWYESVEDVPEIDAQAVIEDVISRAGLEVIE